MKRIIKLYQLILHHSLELQASSSTPLQWDFEEETKQNKMTFECFQSNILQHI